MRKGLLILAVLAVLCFTGSGAALADLLQVQVSVGPIWSNDEAREKCEAKLDDVARKYTGKAVSWSGVWKTVVKDEDSVCVYNLEDF